MFLIFDTNNVCIGTSSVMPDDADLKSRKETCVEYDDKKINIKEIGNYILSDNKKIKKITINKTMSIEDAIQEINNFKTKKESEPILYQKHFFQVDEPSVKRLMIANSNTKNIKWYDLDNQEQELSPEDIKKILIKISARNEYIYEYCAEAKNTVRKAAEKENVTLMQKTINMLEAGYNFESE